MFHILILLVCILSIEIFIRLKFLYFLDLLCKVAIKVIHVIPASNISDHWKERVISKYALIILKCSIQMLLVLLLIISLFFIVDYIKNDFIKFSLSLVGIINSICFAFGYLYLRKFFAKWTTILGYNKNCINLHFLLNLCERLLLMLRLL